MPVSENTISTADRGQASRPALTTLDGRPVAVRWRRGRFILWPVVAMIAFCWLAMVIDNYGASLLLRLLAKLTMLLFVLEIPVVSRFFANVRAWRAEESGGVPCLRCARNMIIDSGWCRCERCNERVRLEFAAQIWLDVHEKARSIGGVPALRVIDTTDYRTAVKVLTVLSASLGGVLIGIGGASAITGDLYLVAMLVTAALAVVLGLFALALSRKPQVPGQWRCAECGYQLRQRLYERCPECGVRNFLSEGAAERHHSTPWQRELEKLLAREVALIIVALVAVFSAQLMVHYRVETQYLRWMLEDERADRTTKPASWRETIARFERAYTNKGSSLRWWTTASVISLIVCVPVFASNHREADRIRRRRDAYARGEFEYSTRK